MDRTRHAAPVEQQDRATAALLDGGKLAEERCGERIPRLAPEVDEADGRQRSPDARGELDALEPRPALRAWSCAPVHHDGTLEGRTLRGDSTGVVARI